MNFNFLKSLHILDWVFCAIFLMEHRLFCDLQSIFFSKIWIFLPLIYDVNFSKSLGKWTPSTKEINCVEALVWGGLSFWWVLPFLCFWKRNEIRFLNVFGEYLSQWNGKWLDYTLRIEKKGLRFSYPFHSEVLLNGCGSNQNFSILINIPTLIKTEWVAIESNFGVQNSGSTFNSCNRTVERKEGGSYPWIDETSIVVSLVDDEIYWEREKPCCFLWFLLYCVMPKHPIMYPNFGHSYRIWYILNRWYFKM